ncbi:MAG: glycosyltransferase [Thiotrichales bacterium]
MNTIGTVVIGRNEGERLRHCLGSLSHTSVPTVYVDSGSSDGSLELASALGATTWALDASRPFSAARARNEGFERLLAQNPGLRYVQFIDGDCTLEPGWIEAARDALDADPRRAAVVGHLLERNAEASTYNRLCALEWKSVPGDLEDFGAFGGISMIRASVFRELGGFNAEVIAGEDSELGVRMGLAGYRVTKIDHAMATHDANMTTFNQWWRRAVRAGHAIGQRSHLNGATSHRDCVKERNSTWFWGIGLPLAALVLAPFTHGLSLLPLVGGYLLLAYRVVQYRRGQGDNLGDALLYARFILLAKFANGLGLIKFHLNKLARRYEIIEYK